MSIESIIEKADKFLDYGEHKKAQILYEKALDTLPKPPMEHPLWIEIMAAIGDALVSQNRLGEATKIYDKIMKHPEADGTPFLHLRRGQIAYGQDKMDLAKAELSRALELGGFELFEDEQEIYYTIAAGLDEEE